MVSYIFSCNKYCQYKKKVLHISIHFLDFIIQDIALSCSYMGAARLLIHRLGTQRSSRLLRDSGELAIQMLVFWPIAWAFSSTLRPYVGRRTFNLLLLMPITAVMVILGASSRGAQLALLVQILVMNYKSIFKFKVLGALSIALFLIWTFLPEEQKDRFETMGDDQTSQQRLLYWENGIQMVQENPVLGVGYFNFSRYFEIYFSDDVLFRKAELPHNILIQVATDVGLTGLFVFCIILMVAFKKSKDFQVKGCSCDQGLIGRCMNISLIGFVVAGQFVTVTYYPFLWIHLSLVVSLNNSNIKSCYFNRELSN